MQCGAINSSTCQWLMSLPRLTSSTEDTFNNVLVSLASSTRLDCFYFLKLDAINSARLNNITSSNSRCKQPFLFKSTKHVKTPLWPNLVKQNSCFLHAERVLLNILPFVETKNFAKLRHEWKLPKTDTCKYGNQDLSSWHHSKVF